MAVAYGRVIVVMGPSGAGKTTLAMALARRLGCAFLDADDLHPASNRAKMTAGVALEDADRWPWLDAVGAVLAGWAAADSGEGRDAGGGEGGGACAGVTACSALKRAYRERLRAALPPGAELVVVWPRVSDAGLAARLDARPRGPGGHFFPPGLLPSQLATLEPPEPDEGALVVDGEPPLDEVVEAVVAGLRARPI